jgi:hypothetical protein
MYLKYFALQKILAGVILPVIAQNHRWGPKGNFTSDFFVGVDGASFGGL